MSLRTAAENIVANKELFPDPRMAGTTDAYLVPLDDIEALEKALRPAAIKIGDQVCDVIDPRHCGKVQDFLDGVALVQFGWRGKFALIRTGDLKVVT